MEGLNKVMKDVARHNGRVPALPIKQEFIERCEGPCNRDIHKQYFEDGTEKVVGCKCDQVKHLQDRQKSVKQKAFIRQSDLPYSKRQSQFDRFETDNDPAKIKAKRIAENYAGKFPINIKAKQTLERVSNYADKELISIAEANEKLNANADEEADDILTNLILSGTPGTGKTMLSNAIYYSVVDSGFNCFFIESTKFIEALKEGFNDQDKKYRLMKFIEEADLLIVDDIGTAFNSPWAVDQFKILTDMRQGKFTIYTTNLTEDEFLKDISLQRVYSRMNQNAYLIEMNFEDKRLKRG